MTGPEHYAEAERLLALADRHTRGVTYDQEWTLTLTAAQVHATLALAAATAVGTAGPDGHAWADVAATRLSASKPEPSTDSSPPQPSIAAPRPRDRGAGLRGPDQRPARAHALGLVSRQCGLDGLRRHRRNLLRAAGSLASLGYAKARGATLRRDLIDVAVRAARHGRGHITLHLPEGWHREQEWMTLFAAACGPPATAA